jgi:fructokinase
LRIIIFVWFAGKVTILVSSLTTKIEERRPAGQDHVFAAIEAGGTKFVCGVGSGPDDLRITQFPTTTPAATIARCVSFFQEFAPGPIAAIGIASFGPVDLHIDSPTWGHVTTTPKAGWRNTDLAGPLRDALAAPVAFDTDVNAAALAEHRWGAGQDVEDCVYLTIGTGIGGGAICGGRLIHGLIHPEIGHIRIPHDPADPFPGNCPFHGDCLEGLASGPAIQARWGRPAAELPPEHPAWDIQARYLALAVSNLACTLSPARVILGGGVMEQRHLFGLIRQHTLALLNGYLQSERITTGIDCYIVPPALGNRAGVLGALALAEYAI